MAEDLDRSTTRTVTRTVEATPDAVWAVLADGWLYANWVVGASRVREVDESWPAAGSRIHHSFGVWPAVIDDTTHVIESMPGQLLKLTARGWPAGEATVLLTLRAEGARTVLTLDEDATSGPGRLIPVALRQALIVPRNTEALQRLALLAEGRSHRA